MDEIHLLHDTVIKWTKAEVHVNSDSVRCLGKMHEHSEANVKWIDQPQDVQQSNEYRELFGIDGEPIEFERNAGWPAGPGPFSSLKLGMVPFWSPFSVGMGPFGRSGGSKFRRGTVARP